MAITFTIPVPLVNQRNEPTDDGQPDENASWNCVPASISSGLEFFTHHAFDGDELKDAVYGQGYTGGQAAAAYVAYCHQRGVALDALQGTPTQLVARLHAEIAAGHPCLITMPSLWGIPLAQQKPGFTTHVALMCGEGPGELRAMNPWGGFYQDRPDSEWEAELCDNEIWIMSALAGALPMGGIPTGWHDDGATLTAPNGHRVVRGFRDYILTGASGSGWNPSDQPLEEEHTVAPYVEHHDHALGPGVRQLFLRTILRWNTPAEGVKESDAGAELQACEAELAALTATNKTFAGEVANFNTALGNAQDTIASLQAQLATAGKLPAKAQAAVSCMDAIAAYGKLP